MKNKITITIIAITLIWAGMICGISFLEAPLKFQAPGISLSLGLGIGKLVFGALTKIEMAFSLFVGSGLLLINARLKTWLFYLLPILIVIIDNLVLMPILDQRIDMIVSGITPPDSNAHLWYVVLELIKLISLIVAGSTTMHRLIKKSREI